MPENILAVLKRSPTTIFVTAQTQYENLGDLLINRVLLHELQKHGQVIVRDIGLPGWYYDGLGLSTALRASRLGPKFNYQIVLAALWSRITFGRRRVYLVEKPGHVFGTASTGQLFGPVQRLAHYAVFRLLGVRICTFGVSIGPFSKNLQVIERLRAALIYHYSVRDSLSVAYARQIGIRRVKRFPDLAWLWDGMRPGIAPGGASEGAYVVFSFRAETHSLAQGDDYQQRLLGMLDLIVATACRRWGKQLVVAFQVESDRDFNQRIQARYAATDAVSFVAERLDLHAASALYQGAYMVFSNRLHVLMLALGAGAIPIAVVDKANHKKVTGIFEDAGLHDLILDVMEPAPATGALEALRGKWPELRAHTAELHARIKAEGQAALGRVLKG